MGKQMILIAEDNAVNCKLLVKILQDEYEIVIAPDGQKAIEQIQAQKDQFSAILLDLIMPVKNGFDVLDYMKQYKLQHIPTIVMTGESGDEVETKALDWGAWDFVPKPYNPKILKTRLKSVIAKSEVSSFAKVKHTAEHDQLTDLYNRRHFFEITELLARKHPGEAKAFIRLDVNQFRLINSFLGERGGDRLLRFMANKIRDFAEVNPWFAYGRIESDIFACFIPFEKETCEKGLEQIIQELIKYDAGITIKPSIGIYETWEDDLNAESMYTSATHAASMNKDKYLVYISYYNKQMSESLKNEKLITFEMQKALEQREFQIYFQPKYNTQTKSPFGAEVLVRWKHPEKGMISPGLFIPVFEKNGFIGKLDNFVWEKTCECLQGWLKEGIHLAPVSVNMSRAELSNTNIVDTLIGLVKKYEIPPKLLNVELTESAYMDNPEIINEVIHRLHQAGFTVLMDDFGSGYSSLNTLKDIDVDILKVDMKFLSIDANNTKSKKILTSVITMAQWIELPVITEGVETEEQYEFLQSIGCEYIQGYYFAKPMPYEEYDRVIRIQEPIEAEYTNRSQEDYMLPKAIKDKIYRDELTGVYNRRYLNEWLFLELSEKENNSLGMVLLDLNSLKKPMIQVVISSGMAY
ncbi:MAG: EAL domain-containing protein [Lachnospiraceae bacterium]|nr:EAL domain-containing protein [Lachnospiraceae bacterium]